MTIYINLEGIKEIRKALGLDNIIISKGILSSILDNVKDLYNNYNINESYVRKAAYLLYRIAKEHPFIDGNKRTAFASADTFLKLNGYYLDIMPKDSVEFIIKVAECKNGEDKVREYIREHIRSRSKL
jgi:death-on-curing protein